MYSSVLREVVSDTGDFINVDSAESVTLMRMKCRYFYQPS